MTALVLRDIGKTYTSRVLDHASLSLERGRVHAIVGENGAGKSTLLKIAAGVVRPDEGDVLIDGVRLQPHTPSEAFRRGVGMVHQHFMLVPTLTGLENLALGSEPSRFGLLDLGPLRARVNERIAALGLDVPLDVATERLGVGERQRLEILRVLLRVGRDGATIILDEPTAVLAPADAHAVLQLARSIAKTAAVAIVTHRLDEVVAVADEVTVLRAGKVVAHYAPGDPAIRDPRALARKALGEAPSSIERGAVAPIEGTAAMTISHLFAPSHEGGGAAIEDVSIEVARGEVVGVAGVEGNGQTSLERAIAGLVSVGRGSIALFGSDVTRSSVAERRARGLAVIPSDRHADAIANELPARDVLRLGALAEVSSRGLIDERALDDAYARAVAELDLRPPNSHLLAGELSGGNQQKLVVARELRDRSRIGAAASTPIALLAVHPTRGVDARASVTLRQRIVEIARRGGGVLVVSSDLAELREISDRIVVLRKGRVVRELPPTASIDALGAAMLGGAIDRREVALESSSER